MLREPLVVALPELHPLAARPRIELADLDGLPMILYPNIAMRGLAQEVADAFAEHALRCTSRRTSRMS